MTVQLKLFHDPQITLAKLNRPYFLYVYSEEDHTYIPGKFLHHLHCSQGKFRLNDIPLLQPRVSANSISWVQRTAKHFTAGYLLFSKDAVTAHGTITYGNCPKTATAHTVMATALPSATFTTQITQQRYPLGTDPNTLPANVWQPGLELQLGYQYDIHQGITQPLVQLAHQDMGRHFDLLTSGKHKLKITLELKDEATFACSENLDQYLAAQITLDPCEHSFTGTVSQTCSDRTGDGVYLWKGLVSSPSKTLQTPAVNQLAAATQLSSEALVQDIPLDINVLVSLLPDDNVTQLSHTLLVENMKWAMGQKDDQKQWLSDFFAQTPPVVDPSRVSLINQNLPWYQDKFAVAYLAKGLSTAPDNTTQPPIQLDDTQKAKLNYYLTNGMGQSNEYNIQSNGVFTQAYVQGQSQLQAYIQDGGQKWAAQVLDELTTPAKLNQVINTLKINFDMTLSNNYTALLATLDPSGEYAQQYQERLFARLTLQTGLFDTVVWDEATTMNWLPQALESLVANYSLATPTLLTTTDSSDFQSAVDDVKNAFKYFGDATKTAKAIYGIFALYKGYSLADQLTKAKAAFAAQYPILGGLGKLLTFLAWVGGVFNTAIAFMNWNSQGDTKQAAAITKTVDLIVGLGQMGIDLLNPLVQGSQQAIQNAMSEASRLDSVIDDLIEELINEGIDSAEFRWSTQAVESALELVDQETQQLKTPALWENVFGKAAVVAKVAGVLITATTLVLNTIDFVRDILDGKPLQQTILDGITMGMTLGSLIIQIVDLVVTSVVSIVLSAVFAFLGVIMTIINLFLPKPQTPPPAQTFQQQYADPFINNLPPPASTPTTPTAAATVRRIVVPDVELIYNLA